MTSNKNVSKCSFARELSHGSSSTTNNNDYWKIFEAHAEEGLVNSTLSAQAFTLPQNTKTTFFITVSSDGKYVASAHGDHSVSVCSVSDGRLVHRLIGHPRSPWALAFHPARSDLLASGCLGGEVRVWDLKTGCSETLNLDDDDDEQEQQTLQDDANNNNNNNVCRTASSAVASLSFHPLERLLAIATGDRLVLWDWANKEARVECHTATPRERVRYVKFDRNGVLYTGVTNAYSLVNPAMDAAGTAAGHRQTSTAAASSMAVVMPIRCRELLTSRNEILQMRAELLRRHEQLLQRYNDLLVRFQELRERYPDIVSAAVSSAAASAIAETPAPPPRWLSDEGSTFGGERFLSLMEENRRRHVVDEPRIRPEPPEPPEPEPEPELDSDSSSIIGNLLIGQNLSYERLCRSYRTMAQSAQRLVTEFQRVCGHYIRLKEEVRRRTGETGAAADPSTIVSRYEAGRAVLNALCRMQEILQSAEDGPSSVDDHHQAEPGTEQRRMYDRVCREARTMLRAHDLLLGLRHRLHFQEDIVTDLRSGRERLVRLIVDLSRHDPPPCLQNLHQRLVTEILHFKLFIRQWKQVVMGNMSTARPPAAGDNNGDSGGDNDNGHNNDAAAGPSTDTSRKRPAPTTTSPGDDDQPGPSSRPPATDRQRGGGVGVPTKRNRLDLPPAAAGQTSTTVVRGHSRGDRPSVVLYVPRDSSRLYTSAADQPSQPPDRRPPDGSAAGPVGPPQGLVPGPPRFVRTGGAGVGGGRSAADWEYSYDLNRAVNRAIAGAFIGTGDAMIANNILDMTCRIQRWTGPVECGRYPDLCQGSANIVLANCKLHNDGSVSVNANGTMLAAFVENQPAERSLLTHSTLHIVSLRPDDLGAVLYRKTFGPEAISVGFSPADDGRHVLVGLASRRYLRLRHSPHTCAVIYALRGSSASNLNGGAPSELKLATIVERGQQPAGPGVEDGGNNFWPWAVRADSVNCAAWLPTPGQGLCYGTNRGQVYMMTPKPREMSLPPFHESHPARVSMFVDEGQQTDPEDPDNVIV